MPQSKWNFEEIKKSVVWEMEGISVLEIAKKLTDTNLEKLLNDGTLALPVTLKTLKKSITIAMSVVIQKPLQRI